MMSRRNNSIHIQTTTKYSTTKTIITRRNTMQNNNDNNIASKPTPYRIILIVDDEPDITSSLKMGLEYNGFEVHTFNDSIEALSNFKAGLYDLVLLDIKMPKMNGFELCQEIKKEDEKVKVCFLTAFEPS